MELRRSARGQAMAPATIQITKEAFAPIAGTSIRWLGNAGTLINSRGTNLMIDPVLEAFDMPLLIDMPIRPEDVPSLDAVLITHIDGDHCSVPTCQSLRGVCKSYHAPRYVAGEMQRASIPAAGHGIGERFQINGIEGALTPADHDWQNDFPEFAFRHWEKEDACGFLLETPDGSVWMPGDSRLMREHLSMPAPDVILFDFSEDPYHISLEGAATLANAYPDAALICIHWGTMDAPDRDPFNGDPSLLPARIDHPERIHVLAPGEAFALSKAR